MFDIYLSELFVFLLKNKTKKSDNIEEKNNLLKEIDILKKFKKELKNKR